MPAAAAGDGRAETVHELAERRRCSAAHDGPKNRVHGQHLGPGIVPLRVRLTGRLDIGRRNVAAAASRGRGRAAAHLARTAASTAGAEVSRSRPRPEKS